MRPIVLGLVCLFSNSKSHQFESKQFFRRVVRQLITAVKRALCCGDPSAGPYTAAAPIPTLSDTPDASATQVPAEGFQITNEGPQSLWRRNTEQALKDLRASKELMIALKNHLREAMATLDANLKIPSKNIDDLDFSSTDLDVFVARLVEQSTRCSLLCVW